MLLQFQKGLSHLHTLESNYFQATVPSTLCLYSLAGVGDRGTQKTPGNAGKMKLQFDFLSHLTLINILQCF